MRPSLNRPEKNRYRRIQPLSHRCTHIDENHIDVTDEIWRNDHSKKSIPAFVWKKKEHIIEAALKQSMVTRQSARQMHVLFLKLSGVVSSSACTDIGFPGRGSLLTAPNPALLEISVSMTIVLSRMAISYSKVFNICSATTKPGKLIQIWHQKFCSPGRFR